MATYSNNTTIKVQGTIGAGSVVPANSYAIATYTVDGFGYWLPQNSSYNATQGGGFQVYYGPGSTVSGTITIGTYTNPNAPTGFTYINANLFTSAVLFQNTP